MEIEELEIYQYIKSCEPISKLNEAQQKSLALAIEIIYIKRGETILQPGKSNHGLYIIRSGAVERTETDGAVVAKFGEKDFFGQASIRRGGEITRKVTAIEDTLLYRFPSTMFLQLFESEPYFRFYFERNLKDIQSIDKDNKSPANILNQTHVKELLHDSTNKVDHKTSVAECAKLMQVSGSTSLLITQNEQVKGIVTDRAFCTKV
ncbi:MAG: cyclic nucleotide-binding domain-containing protein, partial [Kangiellaceae bacterium]|nr:cyclic nucleotide-binding domain-containing protein [Kangiellaceae bacterium]